jgi:hypothetical protein
MGEKANYSLRLALKEKYNTRSERLTYLLVYILCMKHKIHTFQH